MRRLMILAPIAAAVGHIAARIGAAAIAIGHAWRAARACVISTILLIAAAIILAAAGACAALGWTVGRVTAAGGSAGLDVVLVVDQSDSLFDLGGVGSDPNQLRMAAARIVASQLGAEGPLPSYRLGRVDFGTQAELRLPLTELAAPADRAAVVANLRPAEPMGWTDTLAALRLAFHELHVGPRSQPDRQTAVVLFTDGRPQTDATGKPGGEAAYLADLAAIVRSLGARGTAVIAVLLRNDVADADRKLQDVYRPFWIDLAESGIGVRFYDVRSEDDLVPLYRAIAADLSLGVPTPAPPATHTPMPSTTSITAASSTPTTAATSAASPTPTTAAGTAASPTPTATAASAPPPVPSPDRAPVGPIAALGAAGLVILTIGAGAWRLAGARSPAAIDLPAGALRLVHAPPGASVPPTWRLAGAGKTRVTVGSDHRCDLRLPVHPDLPPVAAAIDARRQPDTRPADVITARHDTTVRVQEHPVTHPTPLAHGDHVTIGPYRWRYENVLAARGPTAHPVRPHPHRRLPATSRRQRRP